MKRCPGRAHRAVPDSLARESSVAPSLHVAGRVQIIRGSAPCAPGASSGPLRSAPPRCCAGLLAASLRSRGLRGAPLRWPRSGSGCACWRASLRSHRFGRNRFARPRAPSAATPSAHAASAPFRQFPRLHCAGQLNRGPPRRSPKIRALAALRPKRESAVQRNARRLRRGPGGPPRRGQMPPHSSAANAPLLIGLSVRRAGLSRRFAPRSASRAGLFFSRPRAGPCQAAAGVAGLPAAKRQICPGASPRSPEPPRVSRRACWRDALARVGSRRTPAPLRFGGGASLAKNPRGHFASGSPQRHDLTAPGHRCWQENHHPGRAANRAASAREATAATAKTTGERSRSRETRSRTRTTATTEPRANAAQQHASQPPSGSQQQNPGNPNQLRC